VAEQLQEFDNATGSACHGGRDVGKALYKGLPFASQIATSSATEPEIQRHPQALNRHIPQTPVMPAMTRHRSLSAVRALLISLTHRRDQPAIVNPFGADDAYFGPKGPRIHLSHAADIVADRRL
jgi:hypothetical protein